MSDNQQDDVLNALKFEKETNEKLMKVFRASAGMNQTLYSALVTARYGLRATQEWGGFSDDRQIVIRPKDTEREPVVLVWGELLDNISGLLDEVAAVIGGETFESIKELDKSFDVELGMP
jgi:hypothetical protein